MGVKTLLIIRVFVILYPFLYIHVIILTLSIQLVHNFILIQLQIKKYQVMKTKNYFWFLGIAALFAACSNDDYVNQNISPDNGTKPSELNLKNLDYDGISSILSNITDTGKSIIINDENTTIKEIVVKRNDRTHISGLEDVVLFNGRGQDSVTFTLSSDYATLRMSHDGKSINYVTCKDSKKMNEVVDFYKSTLPSSRSLDNKDYVSYIYTTQSRSDEQQLSGVALNIGEMIKASGNQQGYCGDKCVEPKISVNTTRPHNIATRGFPAAPKSVFVVCLIEQGEQVIPWELSWQLQDAVAALNDISDKYISFDFRTIQSDITMTGNNSSERVENFRQRLLAIEELSDYSNEIFMLCRYNIVDINTAGCAYTNTFSASSPIGQFYACGISSVAAIFPCTLAHEIGHILGAEHVNDINDLMHPGNDLLQRTLLHKNEENRNKILNNIMWE